VAAARYEAVGADDLLVRRLRTRVDVVGKVLGVFIVILAVGAMLMTLRGCGRSAPASPPRPA
jgi:hypothetical protein